MKATGYVRKLDALGG